MRKYLPAFLIALSTMAQADKAIVIHDGWIRHMPGDRPMAGYFVVENKGDRDRRLVGVSSVAFEAVQLHETVEQDGVAAMRPIELVTVPALDRVELAPGGRHLMMLRRRQDLQVGDQVPVTVNFEDGGSQAAVFLVKPTWQE